MTAKRFLNLRCVFLDRDGCINRTTESGYVTKSEEMELLPGVGNAIRQLNRAGIKVIVVTNQRGISQDLYSEADLAAIHARMAELLSEDEARVDAIFYCPHDRDCRDCRKPAPGMFLRAFSGDPLIAPETSVIIGNSSTDVQSGRRAGVATILITDGALEHWDADAVVSSLAEAVSLILKEHRSMTQSSRGTPTYR
jgi:D-glycero-D-manno-heptose 1,7-bisphosphate phosphatase